jgi:hypothetical protein
VQDIAVPEWHYEVLAARHENVKEGKAQFTDWDVAKEQIRELLK